MFILMLTLIVAAGRTKVHPRVVWGTRWHRDGDGGRVRGRLKGVRHERKGVSVGIGGSKDVVDGGLVMERRIDKVLGNLIRWSADSRPVWRIHKRNIVQLRWALSINLNFSKSFWSAVWPSKSDALRSGNIQILWAL